ncbi:MAG: DUF1828 domain-containing protein [Prevotella sp.]|nr:DUF1828 domain-containing protein [Prevotella sp.]
MINNIDSYLESYLKFLKDKSYEVKINANITKLTLPFLDSLNDCTEVYIIKNDSSYTITDNGETISNLNFNGVEIKSSSRQKIFNSILTSYGVILENDSLLIKADENNLFLKKHMLLQCIMKVNDMYVLNKSNVQNIFIEDVKGFFEEKNIKYVPNYRISGKSGLDAYFDFAIPKSQKNPMTLIKVVNKLDKDKVKQIIFDWNDTKGLGTEDKKILILFNDQDVKVKNENVAALNKYGLKSFSWTNKNQILPEVA